MTFVKEIDHQDGEANQSGNLSAFARMRAHIASFSDYGWNLDSIAHLLLFVPFAAATIISLSALDWGVFTMA